MRSLFEGGIYFTRCGFVERHLFEGGVYSRAALNRVNTVATFIFICFIYFYEMSI